MKFDSESVLQRFMECYLSLNKHNLDSLAQIYHPNVIFEDPAHWIQGLPDLREYFQGLYKDLDACQFEIHSSVCSGDEAFLQWTMTFAHPRLAAGHARRVEGCTRLEFRDGKVGYHRDFFDLGEMIYEGVPLLGNVVRHIKMRLAQ